MSEAASRLVHNKQESGITVASAFRSLAAELRAAGVGTPELDARLLVCKACGIGHETFIAEPGRVIMDQEAVALGALAARRVSREPVSRILGAREFWGRDFGLNNATLDPRPDTETLIAAALALIDERLGRDAPLRLLDLGTGTGCILLTLLAELPSAFGVGVDVSAHALHMAGRNAERLGLVERAAFVQCSWTSAIAGAFDVVLANPPYVPTGDIGGLELEVARYDPALALDGGGDGLDAYRAICPVLPRLLRPRGFAALEIGGGQEKAVAAMLAEAGYAAARPWRDLADRVRCLSVEADTCLP